MNIAYQFSIAYSTYYLTYNCLNWVTSPKFGVNSEIWEHAQEREETFFCLMFKFLVGVERIRDEIWEAVVPFSGKEFHSTVFLFLALASWPLQLTVSSCLQNFTVEGCYDLLTRNEFLETLVKCQKITVSEQMQCSLGKQYKKSRIEALTLPLSKKAVSHAAEFSFFAEQNCKKYSQCEEKFS